jgi:hypothetical protein
MLRDKKEGKTAHARDANQKTTQKLRPELSEAED